MTPSRRDVLLLEGLCSLLDGVAVGPKKCCERCCEKSGENGGNWGRDRERAISPFRVEFQ